MNVEDNHSSLFRIGTDPTELDNLANRIVQGEDINHAKIADLAALLDAVQNHPKARIAGIGDDGRPTITNATALTLRRCSIDGCNCSHITSIGVRLSMHSCAFSEFNFESCVICADFHAQDTRILNDADFWKTRFLADARFRSCRFTNDVNFVETIFASGPIFQGTIFSQSTCFNCATLPHGAVFYGITLCHSSLGMSFNGTVVHGTLSFASARIHGQLTLGMVNSRCIIQLETARIYDGARISVAETTLTDKNIIKLPPSRLRSESLRDGQRLSERLSVGPRDSVRRITWEYLMAVTAAWREDAWPWLRRLLGIRSHGNLIEGEDSRRRADLRNAAAQYNLLRDNLRQQPSTDEMEDLCHFRYMDLRRKSGDLLWQVERGDGSSQPRQMGIAVSLQWLLVDGMLYWLIWRNCLGYLVRPIRPLMTAIILVVVCALIYSIGASDSTILYNGQMDPGKNAMDYWNASSLTALYFSVTTFTTLGYGDFAPTGWLRLVAGVQAVLGVTLIALFTVSWGRKMIR